MIVSALMDVRSGKNLAVWGPMVLTLAAIVWLIWQSAPSS